MKVAGSYTLEAPREQVWEALQDPAVLARTLPGCQLLEVTGPDRYAVTVHAGVAAVKGTYAGQVEVSDKQPPDRCVLTASGKGGPGTIRTTAVVTLRAADGGGTRVDYDADAVVGGMIGGVGQRVLVGVSRKTAEEFFAAVDRELAAGPPAAEEEAPEEVAAPAAEAAPPPSGRVFRPPVAPARDRRALELFGATLLGAAVALAGVLLGRRSAR
jgi:carbon monoxide dehydrogenase subunit G